MTTVVVTKNENKVVVQSPFTLRDASQITVTLPIGSLTSTTLAGILAELESHDHSGVYEPVLGNPAGDDYILKSAADGTRSWVNPVSLLLELTALGSLSDVTIISPESGHILQHDGSEFVNLTPAAAGIAETANLGTIASQDADDVAITGGSISVSSQLEVLDSADDDYLHLHSTRDESSTEVGIKFTDHGEEVGRIYSKRLGSTDYDEMYFYCGTEFMMSFSEASKRVYYPGSSVYYVGGIEIEGASWFYADFSSWGADFVIHSGDDLHSDVAGGVQIASSAASGTNPTVRPDKAVPTSGLGYNGGLALIDLGATQLLLDNNAGSPISTFTGDLSITGNITQNGKMILPVRTGEDSTVLGDEWVGGQGDYTVAIGSCALYECVTDWNVSVGAYSGDSNTGIRDIFIGYLAGYGNEYDNVIILGASAFATKDSQFVVGSANAPIVEAVFGEGSGTASPQDFHLTTTSALGTNKVAGTFYIDPGKSTGDATPSKVIFTTTSAGDSGTTQQTLNDTLVLFDGGVEVVNGLTVGGNTVFSGQLEIAQSADDAGLLIQGFDDQDSAYVGLAIDASGDTSLVSSQQLKLTFDRDLRWTFEADGDLVGSGTRGPKIRGGVDSGANDLVFCHTGSDNTGIAFRDTYDMSFYAGYDVEMIRMQGNPNPMNPTGSIDILQPTSFAPGEFATPSISFGNTGFYQDAIHGYELIFKVPEDGFFLVKEAIDQVGGSMSGKNASSTVPTVHSKGEDKTSGLGASEAYATTVIGNSVAIADFKSAGINLYQPTEFTTSLSGADTNAPQINDFQCTQSLGSYTAQIVPDRAYPDTGISNTSSVSGNAAVTVLVEGKYVFDVYTEGLDDTNVYIETDYFGLEASFTEFYGDVDFYAAANFYDATSFSGDLSLSGALFFSNVDDDTKIYEYSDDLLSLHLGGVDRWFFADTMFYPNVPQSAIIVRETSTSTNPVFTTQTYETGLGFSSNEIGHLIANEINLLEFDGTTGANAITLNANTFLAGDLYLDASTTDRTISGGVAPTGVDAEAGDLYLDVPVSRGAGGPGKFIVRTTSAGTTGESEHTLENALTLYDDYLFFKALKIQQSGTSTSFEGIGTNLIFSSTNYCQFQTGAGQSIRNYCGGTFTWGDVDDSNATRMSLDSATGNLTVTGDVITSKVVNPSGTLNIESAGFVNINSTATSGYIQLQNPVIIDADQDGGDYVSLTIRGEAGYTEPLTEWQDSTSAVVASVSKTGDLWLGGDLEFNENGSDRKVSGGTAVGENVEASDLYWRVPRSTGNADEARHVFQTTKKTTSGSTAQTWQNLMILDGDNVFVYGSSAGSLQLTNSAIYANSNNLILSSMSGYVNVKSAEDQGMRFDAGSTFVWRDRDDSYVTRMILDSATGDLDVTGNITSNSEAVPTAEDLDMSGFSDRSETTIGFNDTTYTFTLTDSGSGWSYFRAGKKITISGNKTVTLSGSPPASDAYFVYIDDESGTLTAAATPWDLSGDKVVVAIIHWNNSLTPKYILADERHDTTFSKRLHAYEHFTLKTRFQDGGLVSGYTVTPSSPADSDNQFDVAIARIWDEDIQHTLPAVTGGTDNYHVDYRTGASTWEWVQQTIPFKYTAAGYIQYDNSGTMTQGQNNKYYTTYLIATHRDTNGDAAWSVIHGQSEFDSLAEAQSETIGDLTLTGYESDESVALWQLVWETKSAYSTTGKCRLAATPRRITVNLNTADASPQYGTMAVQDANNVDITGGSIVGLIGPGEYTVATVPTASEYSGKIIYVSDGNAGSPCLARSNGTTWKVYAIEGSDIAAS